MKKNLSLLLAVVLLLSLWGCQEPEPAFSGFVKEGEDLVLTRGDMSVTVSGTTGLVTGVKNAREEITMDSILVDVGINGEQLLNQLGYKDLSVLATYELPTLYARKKDLPGYAISAITATAEGFEVTMTCGEYSILYRYTFLLREGEGLGLQLDVTLSTTAEQATVNGVGFLVNGIGGMDQATFEFPGSTPAGKRSFANAYRVAASDYSAPAVVLADETKSHSILFVDTVEKWTTGSFADSEGRPCVAFLAAVEGYLTKDAPMTVGSLYIPLDQQTSTGYARIQQFWEELGYRVPSDTNATENLVAIYSGHPFGTMDTDYFNRWTLAEYAERVDSVAAMGFDAIWLLPVFSHSGDNVYEPIDQGLIDIRYGGIEEAGIFVEKAHALGMKVLFDFVPHGPRPVYGFAKDHDHWVSKDASGNNQIEWECVSFDYNHPEYHAYNIELAAYYAREIGLDGARIDCSMGGLPNWSSAAGLRASAAGLQAGLDVVGAYREGFQQGGADVLLLPENFHPSPAYANVTDVFYDMPLYRCLFNLNHSGLDEAGVVEGLTDFLTAEHATSVKGQLKLRFLGNHDTVHWTFDAERAQTLYGTDKAEALWKIFGWIDGVLYIYQGDEDPATYRLQGENLEGFFTELIAAKREYLPNTLDIEYIRTGSPVFAFRRFDETVSRLVLINLSGETQSYPLEGNARLLTNLGGCEVTENTVTLEPYAGVILEN